MIYENRLKVLDRLLEATRLGAFTWQKDEDGWFSAVFPPDRRECLSIRFLYIEATNQTGADPHIVQVLMTGFAGFFAVGTEGYARVVEILGDAFPDWKEHVDQVSDSTGALEFLDSEIRKCQEAGGGKQSD